MSLSKLDWFPDRDDQRPAPRPRIAPDRYESRSWRNVFISWAVATVVIFGCGTLTGNKLNDAEVRDLMLERQEAENKASAAANEATYWQSEATSATAAYEAVESDVASLTASVAQWQLQANEASSTIATLRQQKATPKPVAPKPTQVSWSGGVEQWRPLVAAYFPAEAVDEALLCIGIETGGTGNPSIVSPSGKYVGLFQMDAGWGSFEDRTNPEWAIAVAASSYRAKGWSAWPPMLARGYR